MQLTKITWRVKFVTLAARPVNKIVTFLPVWAYYRQYNVGREEWFSHRILPFDVEEV